MRALYAFERYDEKEQIMTAANCGRRPEKLTVYRHCRDLLTGNEYENEMTLPGGRVVILLNEDKEDTEE